MFRQTSTDSLNIIADGSELALTEQETAQSSINVPENLLCKNRLQERAQRSGLPLPVYQTINEGDLHEPMFRSTVFVDGTYITSPNAFPHRKAAEQDVATVALASLTQKIKEEGYSLIREVCNSESGTVILEIIKSKFKLYAALNNVKDSHISQNSNTPLGPNTGTGFFFPFCSEKEVESTGNGSVPLVVNTDLPFGNEKGVESSGKGNAPLVVSTGIPLGNGKKVGITQADNIVTSTMSNAPLVVNTGFPFGNEKEVGISWGANKVMSTMMSEAFANQLKSILAMQQPVHELKKLKREPSSIPFTPTAFLPPAMEQPLSVGPSSAKKRNRKNKKKKKQLQVNTLFRATCSAALNQARPS